MAASLLGLNRRSQTLLRPISVVAAITAFCISVGALRPAGACFMAIAAGVVAGWIAGKVGHGNFLSRLIMGCAMGVLFILFLHVWLHIPFLIGGVLCIVAFFLM